MQESFRYVHSVRRAMHKLAGCNPPRTIIIKSFLRRSRSARLVKRALVSFACLSLVPALCRASSMIFFFYLCFFFYVAGTKKPRSPGSSYRRSGRKMALPGRRSHRVLSIPVLVSATLGILHASAELLKNRTLERNIFIIYNKYINKYINQYNTLIICHYIWLYFFINITTVNIFRIRVR